jgi:hypothetical protein
MELKEEDASEFCKLTRMMPETFDILLEKIQTKIEKKSNCMRTTISA